MTTIYAIGSNGSGQLGIAHKEDVSVPKQVLFASDPDQPIIQVKAGGNHTLLLSSGIVYSCGDPTTGACGVGSGISSSGFRFHQLRLTSDGPTLNTTRFAFCAATWEASILVQKDEHGRNTKIYTLGIGNKGELGQGEFIFRCGKASLLKDFPPEDLEVIDLASSVSHVVVVLNNGDVYGWGSGRKGQLGQPEGIFHTPRKISQLDFKIVRAVCGREFTYLLGEPTSGNYAIFGSDKLSVISSAPKDVHQWKDVGASWGSIFVLKQGGTLLSWGRDDHGQLAPAGLPPLSHIAIGSEHGLGLTKDGEVLAWGWGEHGNCGPDTTDGDVKGRWNVVASSKYLPAESKISYIGAGCATSWICLTT